MLAAEVEGREQRIGKPRNMPSSDYASNYRTNNQILGSTVAAAAAAAPFALLEILHQNIQVTKLFQLDVPSLYQNLQSEGAFLTQFAR